MNSRTSITLVVLAVMATAVVCLTSAMFVVRITAVPDVGQSVIVKSSAEGCKIFDSGHGEWIQCSDLTKSTAGITVDKKGYAHVYAGRVRVQFEYAGYPGVFVYRWYKPADIEAP